LAPGQLCQATKREVGRSEGRSRVALAGNLIRLLIIAQGSYLTIDIA
jgi:hypothetical protein